ARVNSNTFSLAARQMNVAVLGPGRGIITPSQDRPLVTSLSLYDIRGAPSVAADVSHVDAHSEERLNGYPAYQLDEALDGVQVVVIPAGVPRKVRFVFLLWVSSLKYMTRL
ncbi:mitochondrial malate dehydrogenase precursor, partial [Suillus occidentalis]